MKRRCCSNACVPRHRSDAIAAIAGDRRELIKAAVLYFAVVFGAGFAMGTLRVLWVEAKLGARGAEILEAPVILAVSFVAARWIVRRFSLPAAPGTRLATGGIALALMLLAEFGLVLSIRGITLAQYFATRDPVSGIVYYATLMAFALLPAVVARD